MGKPSYIALGLMSGTSLDGVDVAFLETDGERIISFGPGLTQDYSVSDCETLTQATQAALRWQFKGSAPNSFAAAEDVIARVHSEAVEAICAAHPDWAQRLDMIGFHGQTVLHHPPIPEQQGRTLQLGHGQVLADRFGVPVVYDFRSDDVAAGGQGAPLAPIYHKALVEYSGVVDRCGVLNIGGVSNVTLIDEDTLVATDCGPGNGPLDNWIIENTIDCIDVGGKHSLSGVPEMHMVDKWLSAKFFETPIPRSADRYDFDVSADLEFAYERPTDWSVSYENCAASLSCFTASAVRKTIGQIDFTPERLIVCGGGRYNKAMLWMLEEELRVPIETAESMGWNGDAIEAEAFAYLAVRTKLGLPISFPMTTGVPEPMTGGRIAYPNIKPLSSRT